MQSPSKSTADKILEQFEEKKRRNELTRYEFEELRKACRGIFTTKNGIHVARAMMKMSGIYSMPKNTTNPIEMGAERGKEHMYLFFVVGMLSPEQIAEIERPKKGED